MSRYGEGIHTYTHSHTTLQIKSAIYHHPKTKKVLDSLIILLYLFFNNIRATWITGSPDKGINEVVLREGSVV